MFVRTSHEQYFFAAWEQRIDKLDVLFHIRSVHDDMGPDHKHGFVELATLGHSQNQNRNAPKICILVALYKFQGQRIGGHNQVDGNVRKKALVNVGKFAQLFLVVRNAIIKILVVKLGVFGKGLCDLLYLLKARRAFHFGAGQIQYVFFVGFRGKFRLGLN